MRYVASLLQLLYLVKHLALLGVSLPTHRESDFQCLLLLFHEVLAALLVQLDLFFDLIGSVAVCFINSLDVLKSLLALE